MIEKFKKLLQETAEANYDLELLDDAVLYDKFDNAISLNLVFGQLNLFKYFAIKLCIKYLEHSLNAKDYEIIDFYSNLDVDREFVTCIYNAFDYKLVVQIRQLCYDCKCTDEKLVKMFDNVKYQAYKHQPYFLTEETKQKMSIAQNGRSWYNNGVENYHGFECPEGYVPGKLTFNKETRNRIIKGMHWYNNGTHSIRALECPEGYTEGRIDTRTTTGMHWYNNGTINKQAYECPEGFVPGKLLASCKRWYNNGIQCVLANECPEGFVPGRLYKRKK